LIVVWLEVGVVVSGVVALVIVGSGDGFIDGLLIAMAAASGKGIERRLGSPFESLVHMGITATLRLKFIFSFRGAIIVNKSLCAD
jgi:hypothetical protein